MPIEFEQLEKLLIEWNKRLSIKTSVGDKTGEFLKFSTNLSAELLQPFDSNITIIAIGKLSFSAESSFIELIYLMAGTNTTALAI